MTDATDRSTVVTGDEPASEALEATGVYRAGTDVVFYDSEQPLAWVQADHSVLLAEMT